MRSFIEITVKPRLFMESGRWCCAGLINKAWFKSPRMSFTYGKSAFEAWAFWEMTR